MNTSVLLQGSGADTSEDVVSCEWRVAARTSFVLGGSLRESTELDFLVSEVSVRPAKFPATRYGFAASFCDAYLEESVRAARTIDLSKVEHAAEMLLQAYTSGTSVFSCGNGGSAAVANHLQCDHLKGVKTGTDLSLE